MDSTIVLGCAGAEALLKQLLGEHIKEVRLRVEDGRLRADVNSIIPLIGDLHVLLHGSMGAGRPTLEVEVTPVGYLDHPKLWALRTYPALHLEWCDRGFRVHLEKALQAEAPRQWLQLAERIRFQEAILPTPDGAALRVSFSV